MADSNAMQRCLSFLVALWFAAGGMVVPVLHWSALAADCHVHEADGAADSAGTPVDGAHDGHHCTICHSGSIFLQTPWTERVAPCSDAVEPAPELTAQRDGQAPAYLRPHPRGPPARA